MQRILNGAGTPRFRHNKRTSAIFLDLSDFAHTRTHNQAALKVRELAGFPVPIADTMVQDGMATDWLRFSVGTLRLVPKEVRSCQTQQATRHLVGTGTPCDGPSDFAKNGS